VGKKEVSASTNIQFRGIATISSKLDNQHNRSQFL